MDIDIASENNMKKMTEGVAIKPKLLLIDDSAPVRAVMKYMLSDKYHILEADKGPAGISLVEESEIPLVLLDYNMPGMSGLETLVGIKKISPRTVVSIISAQADGWLRARALKSGAFECMCKPFNIERLDSLLERMEIKAKEASL